MTKPADVPVCPDCSSQHLGRCGGLSFAARLRTVSADAEATPTQTRRVYYDHDVVTDQFRGQDRHERKERLMDATQGYGYARTDANGDVWAKDPKTHEPRILTPSEVNHAYLTGGAEPA